MLIIVNYDEIVFPDVNPVVDGDERLILNKIVKYLESTSEDSWCVDVYRSSDGLRNCVLGHIQSMVVDDGEGMLLMERFESVWGNSYTIGMRANDGEDSVNYPQLTAKERSIAFIVNLLNGVEDSVVVSMEKDFLNYK